MTVASLPSVIGSSRIASSHALPTSPAIVVGVAPSAQTSRSVQVCRQVLVPEVAPTVRGPATTLREGKREETEAILEGSGLAAEA